MNIINKLFKSDTFGLKLQFTTLRFKIVFWFVIAGAVPAIGIGTYAVLEESKALGHEAIEVSEDILSAKMGELGVFLGDIEGDLADISQRFTLHNLVEAIPTKDVEEIGFWLEPVQQDFSRFASIRKRYSRIQFVSKDGQEIIRVDFSHNESTIQPKENLLNLSSQPYFDSVNALEPGEFNIIPLMTFDPKIPKEGFDGPVIRYGRALFTPDGERVGVVILTALANDFLNAFGQVEHGKMILFNEEGYFLYHPDPEIRPNWKTLQTEEKFQNYYEESLYRLMLEEGAGHVADHATEFLSYQELDYDLQSETSTWLGVYSKQRTIVLAPAIKFRNHFIVILIVLVAIIFVFAMMFGKQLTGPLAKVVLVAQAIANRDLTQEKLQYTSKDEIGVLADSFDTMVDALRNQIGSITKASATVSQSSEEIASSVQEQSSIATEQSASLTEIMATLEELSASSTQIADNSNSVVEVSTEALSQTEVGVESIEELKEKMDQIGNDNTEAIKEIVDLGKKSKEIGKVMEIINNIADQTKLIAFNAAIEASSAGEAGKRFGVVAVEIRRLADNVMSSTQEIEERIQEIQQAINRLVIASEKGANRINEGTALGTQTLTHLESLLQGAKSTNEAATQISLSTQQQKTATDQVLKSLREIEKGIQQSSVAIQQATIMTKHLMESSQAMKSLAGEFKLNEKG